MPVSAESTSSSSGSTSAGWWLSAELAFGRFVFRYRDALAPGLLFAAVALTRPRAPFGSERADAWLDAAGLVVALVGQTLRMLVIGLAYIKRGGVARTIAADDLVTDGVFAHSRNPLYVGNGLMVLGLTMVWNAPAVYATILPLVALAYLSIVRAEEEFLASKFGDEYRAYRQRVNRFLPDPRGFRETWGRFTFDWQRVVKKDYGTTFSFVTTALTMIGIEKIDRLGLDGAAPTLVGVGLAWVAAFAAWAAARRFKKRKPAQARRGA